MNPKRLHIICFDIPYPPSYGGVIPVFYRIKELSAIGVRITLHCFYKGTIGDRSPLEAICEKVYYYPRKTGWRSQLSVRPYGVVSRSHPDLLRHLLEDDAPILFEGLVSCGLMDEPALQHRAKYFRECNVEHDYYHALGRATRSLWKKIYLHIEAVKLRLFEGTIRNAKCIFTLAHQDEAYFKATYPDVPTIYFPCFHGHKEIQKPTETNIPYILYHGNLSVAENEKAAMYIMEHLADQIPHAIAIAGFRPSQALLQAAKRHKNVQVFDSPDEKQMNLLLRNARVHLLLTFQATGIKLKLLNVLYTTGHVVVNEQMVEGTELQDVCAVGENDEQWIELCNTLFDKPMSDNALQKRLRYLERTYNDKQSAKIIVNTLFEL